MTKRIPCTRRDGAVRPAKEPAMGEEQTTQVTETTETTETTEQDPGTEGLGDAGKAVLAKEREAARDADRRAKAAESALEKLRKQHMSENEKAIEAAKAEGRAEALKETGLRLVDAEVKAAAAGRKVDVDALLDGLDRGRFLTDEGEPDSKAIAAWVDRIAPKAGSVDLGQGTRSTGSGGQDMNALLRNAAGRAQ